MKKLETYKANDVSTYTDAIETVMSNEDVLNNVLKNDELKNAIQTCARLALGFCMLGSKLTAVEKELTFPDMVKSREDIVPNYCSEADLDTWVKGQAHGIKRAIKFLENSINPELDVNETD